jgi:N-acetylmuramoyl-L-alanine amidase
VHRALWLVFAACGDPSPPTPAVDAANVADGGGGGASIAGTPVESFATTSCSTGVVLELSRQIAEEVDCMLPGQLVPFEASTSIELTGGAILPYLGEDARADLVAAAASRDPATLRVTSAFRTVVQQWLLRRWFELGRCGITAAAQPGSSNHESGRALDISNYGEWISAFAAHRWDHSVPGDPVHFDHTASPDIRGADVLAFQRLWNRNAPGDAITEDGVYGPATEARIKRAPAEGFGLGAGCSRRLAMPILVEDAATACAR